MHTFAGFIFFDMKQKYNKRAKTIPEQIEKLKSRGMIISNENKFNHFLFNNNYFRLRAYTFPFQDGEKKFKEVISEEDIMTLYNFDAKLRRFVFSNLERIEISLRTQIAHHYSFDDVYFYLEPNNFDDKLKFICTLYSLIEEENRSKDRFVEHHTKTYSEYFMPLWKVVEIMSFGTLSMLFKNIKEDKIKTKITRYYGLQDVDVLSNWLRNFTILRNICCHHARLWNRTLSKMKYPKKTLNNFSNTQDIKTNKLYFHLLCMKYIIDTIEPDNNFKNGLDELMKECPLNQQTAMGFPNN
jgi:abortive infection bacteriophage resistance protein